MVLLIRMEEWHTLFLSRVNQLTNDNAFTRVGLERVVETAT